MDAEDKAILRFLDQTVMGQFLFNLLSACRTEISGNAQLWETSDLLDRIDDVLGAVACEEEA